MTSDCPTIIARLLRDVTVELLRENTRHLTKRQTMSAERTRINGVVHWGGAN
jgi:hypothetical protein